MKCIHFRERPDGELSYRLSPGGIMKRICLLVCIAVLIFSAAAVTAGGSREAAPEVTTVRVADQVPNLITPGIWDGQAFSLNSSIYEYLLEIDPETGELIPTLAKDWHTEDGKTWVFELQEGVTFHNGSPFTSADVKFTLERTQNPDIGHLKQQDLSIIESIETPDDYTVIITLKGVRPTFDYVMTDYNMAILSSGYDYDSLGESSPMGTGPFKLQQMIPKESALLVRNPDYWVEGLPVVDRLAIYFVADIEASISMLEDDRVDVVPFATPIIRQRLERVDHLDVIAPYQEQRFLSMAQDREPFNDNRVRLALKYAMDPVELARSTQGELGKDVFYDETPIMRILAQHKELPLRGQNIEKAKSLLAEAGYPDGLTVELYYASDHPFNQNLAQTIQELAAPAGFSIELQGFTRDIYLSQYWMNRSLTITGWGGRIDPSMLLSLAFYSEGPWNESHMNNPEVDMLIERISSEVDDDQRQEYYDRLQEVFYEEGTVINIQVPFLVALNNRVVNYRHPLTMLPQYKYVDIRE